MPRAHTAASSAMPSATPTAEQLALAWRHMRRPASWPATLEAALQDPRCAVCLAGYARTMACTIARAPFRAGSTAGPVHSLPVGAPVPPTPSHQPARHGGTAAQRRAKQSAQPFDARRAAANDFDD